MGKSAKAKKAGAKPVAKEEEEPVSDTVTEKVAATVLREAVAKHTTLTGDLLAYSSSLCAELANSDDETSLEKWESSLSPVLGYLLPEGEITTVCEKLKSTLVAAGGHLSIGGAKDPTVLAHVDPLTLGFMGKILLLRARMNLLRGHRYGLVGENGAGKSTLMKKLANRELPGFPKDIKIMYVEPDFDEQNEELYPADYLKLVQVAEKGKTDDAEIEKVLSELQFTPKLRETKIGELSGGWKMRVSLARATMVKADLLLLDEPTNHLDTSAVEWLMGFLQSVTVTAIVISHEPFFLDAIATDVIMIKRKKLQTFEGNFSAFTKQQRDFTAADLESSVAKGPKDALNFRFPDPGKPIGVASLTRAILTVKNVDFAYSKKGGTILRDITCKLSLSSRVAVVGPNGAGKSTLVKLMVGDIKETKGNVWKHHNLLVAYVAQHSFSHLETVASKPVMQYIKQRFGRGWDNESSAYKSAPDETETFVTTYDIREGQVEEILGRRKFKNAMAYEVKWVDKDEARNTWEDITTLRKLGAGRLVEQCDERIKAKKSGLDQRALTNLEVTRHLMDFGLDKQYSMAKIENLSGGQKCKLVLAAAMWLRPHLLVLDEPTNYLDLEALGALARAINKYKGGMIMVSHNKEFMAEICNEKWTVDEGRLAIEMGIEKPALAIPKTRLEAGMAAPRRGRETSRRHSSMHKSGNDWGGLDPELLGKEGLCAPTVKQQLQALDDLEFCVQSDDLEKGDFESGLKSLFAACTTHGLRNVNAEVWGKVIELCEKTISKYGSKHCELLLSIVEDAMSAAPAVVASVPEEAPTPKSDGVPLYKVGDKVQAMWTDKQFYKGKILKVVATKPAVKYSVSYPDFGKVATIPEKGGIRKAATRRAANQVAEKKADKGLALIRAGVLVLRGYLARFQGDVQKLPVVNMLIEALSVEGISGSVAELNVLARDKVARSLTALAHVVPMATREEKFELCFSRAQTASSYSKRSGAASCVAAMVTDGHGVIKFELINKLNSLMQGKDQEGKLAGLLMYDRLFTQLGPSFEYQCGAALSVLMGAFRDRDSTVVKACVKTTKAMMHVLTPHGAKLMLPSLLEGLQAKSWKVKVDSTRVLGSMAFCTPALMASSLPLVVPHLLEVMSEPKKEVASAAEGAVRDIASVITNPEIKPIVDMLHQALRDSFKYTKPALDSLAKTSFAHAIDPASLAMIMPIAMKGCKDRMPDTQKTALKVVAALAALVLDIHDILPYLPELMALLRVLVMHNLPEIRQEAAKALGAIVNEVGQEDRYFPGLSKWITDSMQDKDSTTAQMAGAGQALAYMMHGKDMECTTKHLPELLALTEHKLPNAKAGHLNLLVILSDVYGEVFGDLFLGDVLPACLKGLEDPVLPVSEAAFEASQEFVSKNTMTQLHLILPMLVEGLKHSDYKIRTNYLQLVGTVLLNLVTTANFGMSIRFYGDGNSLREGETANVASKDQEITIEAAMGPDARNNLFALMYLMRSDPVDTVGSMAWRVWHLVVPNEKDLLQQVLPTLMENCREALSCNDKNRRETGRRSIGGLVVSTGQEGLYAIIPNLQAQLTSDDGETRKAACLGFSEVLKSADRAHIGAFLNDVIPLIRDMLCDEVFQVRVGASHAFRQLYKNVGNKAVEKIAPYLIDSMKGEQAAETTVSGLMLVLESCARNTLFYLIATIFATLKDYDNDANNLLRSKVVELLVPLVNDVIDVATIKACNALQRFCEESPEKSAAYLVLFVPNMLRRMNPYLREPVKQALYQVLYASFQMDKDKAKGKAALIKFMNNPPPGFVVQGQVGIIDDDQADDLVKVLSNLTLETQITNLAQMKLPEEAVAVDETPTDAATTGEGGGAGEAEVKLVIGPSDKQCFKCKQVKPKTKFSGKMQKKPKGVCKVCS